MNKGRPNYHVAPGREGLHRTLDLACDLTKVGENVAATFTMLILKDLRDRLDIAELKLKKYKEIPT